MTDYIIWNPSENLLDLGFFQLKWYSLLFGFGFVAGYYFVKQRFTKFGIDTALLENLAVYIIIGTLLGARLGHCFFYDWAYFSQHPLEILLPFRFSPNFEFVGFRGLASHGGGIGVISALLLYAYRYKLNKLWLLDTIALAVPLTGIFIRLGNLMNSEIVGKATTVSWAFIFPAVDQVPRHPAQLYEAFIYLLIFIFLYFLKERFNHNGMILGLMLILVFTARFTIEFYKANQSFFEENMTLNMGQLLSIPYIISGLILLFISRRKPLKAKKESLA